MPSERTLQQFFLGHRLVIGFFDYYYAAMHFSTMLLFLIWLFWRHRDRYRQVRQVMAWTTLGCLIVQLLPVAPPRMLPGIVDTARLYHESVYSHGLPIDQLSSMPSVHVAWAVLVGYYIWRISPSRWRFIGPAHSVLMIIVVVATGNHWWLDGIVAVAILSLSAWAVAGMRCLWRVARGSERAGARIFAQAVRRGRTLCRGVTSANPPANLSVGTRSAEFHSNTRRIRLLPLLLFGQLFWMLSI